MFTIRARSASPCGVHRVDGFRGVDLFLVPFGGLEPACDLGEEDMLELEDVADFKFGCSCCN